MKFLIFILAAAVTAAAPAQTASKSSSAARTARSSTATTGVKLPPGVPPARGVLKTAFSLRYQDIRVGTGKEAEPGKLYSVNYTGWRASDGVKFDSSYDRRTPVLDKDNKPVMGEDGKPKLGPPHAEPMKFPQGMGRLIPGFDQGFSGMKVGGKRRIFIPWQLAYGTRTIPDRGTEHPGIPAKSDLIFDVELVDIADLPAMPQRPGMMPGHPIPHPGAPPAPGAAPTPGASPATPAPGQPAATPAPGASPAPGSPATTPQPTTTPQPHN